MKKLVYSALALTLTGVPALAADNGWSGLDKEIESLSSSLQNANTAGPKVGGWVITSYRHSSDIDANGAAAGEPNQSGFQFESVRLQVEGDAGKDYSYRVSVDLKTGTALIKDAYATWKIADNVMGKIGRFKEPVLRSAIISDNKLLFLDRTFLGEALGRRDLGAQVSGSFDVVDWAVAFQDGSDGQADEHTYTLRATANVVGKSGSGKREGAYDAGEETNVTVGIAYQDDTNKDKGTIIAGEASMTAGPFSVAAEIVDFDKGDAGTFGLGLMNGTDVADTTPWDVTVSYAITPEWEVQGRYEDADNDLDETSYSLGANYYVDGHNIKWQGQWKSVKSDGAVGDVDQLGVGLAVSF